MGEELLEGSWSAVIERVIYKHKHIDIYVLVYTASFECLQLNLSYDYSFLNIISRKIFHYKNNNKALFH